MVLGKKQLEMTERIPKMSDNDKDFVFESRFEPVKTIVDQTLPEFIWSQVGDWDNLVAFECALSGKKYTHGQVRRLSRAFGAALIKEGLKDGEVVAIMLENCPEYAIALLGVMEAGLVASPVSPSFTSFELSVQLRNCEAKRIVTSIKLYPVVAGAMKSLGDAPCGAIVIGETPPDGACSFEELLETDTRDIELLKGSAIDAREKVALLPYSSGTTGPPKGVMLTHSNVATNLLQSQHPSLRYFKAYGENGAGQARMVGVLPFCHIFGLNCIMLGTLTLGAHCVTLPKFDAGLFVKTVKTFKPTVLPLVTPLLNFLVNTPALSDDDFSPLEVVLTGAAPVGSHLINALKAKTNCYYCEGYGMTELSPVTHMSSPGKAKFGAVGLLVPSTKAKIIDPETGKSLQPNEVGELCIQGPQVMKGYFNNDSATKATIDAEGYLRTGDLAYIDTEGYMFIEDRLKELIKVKGLQVAPSELENLIRQVPGVEDCAVIGVPHEKFGEAPRGYIVRRSGAQLTEKDVECFLDAHVSHYKKLVGGVEFVNVIPKAASGKILRRELKRLYIKRINLGGKLDNGCKFGHNTTVPPA